MASAPEHASDHTPQVVLVHGACHGSWCWERVVEPLGAQGVGVHTVDLPMTSLEADAEAVRLAVRRAKAIGPVLLAGHSYGGVVITAGGHEADQLLYCTATMPDNGQSAVDVFSKLFTPELEVALDTAEGGTLLLLHPERSVPAFFNRCSPELVEKVRPRLRPIRQECFTTAVGQAAWRQVPASYIVCTDDHAMAVDYQRECASLLGDSISLDCDHSLFYTATDALVARVAELAHRLVGRS